MATSRLSAFSSCRTRDHENISLDMSIALLVSKNQVIELSCLCLCWISSVRLCWIWSIILCKSPEHRKYSSFYESSQLRLKSSWEMSEIGLKFVAVYPISPCILHYFLLKYGVRGVFLSIGPGISARVVIEDVKWSPKAYAPQKRTVAHAHNY